jgi:hypothetical protein
MSQAGLLGGGGSGPSTPTTYAGNTGTATPAANILNIIGSGGIATSATGNTITITGTSSSFTWNTVTTATALVTNNGYIPKGGTSVVFTLPASASVGDTYRIAGYGNLWRVAQNAGQTIFLGNQTTTAGTGGSLTATLTKDCVELLCVTANTEFEVITSMGNILVT